MKNYFKCRNRWDQLVMDSHSNKYRNYKKNNMNTKKKQIMKNKCSYKLI